jgi:hypothetical protein
MKLTTHARNAMYECVVCLVKFAYRLDPLVTMATVVHLSDGHLMFTNKAPTIPAQRLL